MHIVEQSIRKRKRMTGISALKCLIMVLLVFVIDIRCVSWCLAQSHTDESLQSQAEEYLESVWAADWETMGSYLTEESIYQDFTMTYFGGVEIDLIGRDSIVTFYKGASDGARVEEVTNEILYKFVAGNSVVYELNTTVRLDGAFGEAPGTKVTATFRVITFIQLEQGKVIRHIDFSDYKDAMGQVAAQVEASKQE